MGRRVGGLPTFRHEARFATWLWAVASTSTWRETKRIRRRSPAGAPATARDDDPEPAIPDADAVDPLDEATAVEALADLCRALRALTEQRRDVCQRLWANYTAREIAE